MKTNNIKLNIFQDKIIDIKDKQRRFNIIIIEVTTEGNQSKGVAEVTIAIIKKPVTKNHKDLKLCIGRIYHLPENINPDGQHQDIF